MLATQTLGRTGLKVTQLGYGSMGLRGPRTWGVRVVNEEDAERFLHRVLDVGINFIDTAPDYGICEERIGRYLHGRRNEFVLATKCGCSYTQHDDHIEISHTWTKDVVARNLERSLQRLQTDHIDILQFHGGNAKTLRDAGLIDQLLDFKSQGIIGFLGVSTKLPDIEGLIDLGVFDTFQIPYSCLMPTHHDWITKAAAQGAGIILRGGIAHGGPDAEIERPVLNELWEKANIDDVRPDDMSRAELILRFTLSHPHCHTVIVGTCNAQHLDENLNSLGSGALPTQLYKEISQRIADASLPNN